MSHIADPEFYKSVRERLGEAGANGEIVCCEGIRLLSDKERSELTAKQLKAIDAVDLVEYQSALARILGVTEQRNEIPNDERWRRCDLDQLSVVRLMGPFERRCARFLAQSLKNTPEQQLAEFCTRDKVIAQFTATRSWWLKKLTSSQAVIDARTRVAVQGILKATSDTAVVATWGGDHLPGIAAGLEKAGFRPVSTEWFLVLARREPTAG